MFLNASKDTKKDVYDWIYKEKEKNIIYKYEISKTQLFHTAKPVQNKPGQEWKLNSSYETSMQ